MPKLKFKLSAIESENLSLVCGPVNSNLNQIEESLEIIIRSRGNSFSITGEKNNAIKGKTIIEDLALLAESRDSVSADEVHFSIRRALNGATKDKSGQIFELAKEKELTIQTPRLFISPRNKSQGEFLSSIYDKDIAFGIGPAGTGKTYLAVAAAVNHFIEEKVNKIILTRPAVEAGENLGFLPGDLSQKVDPYLRPLYDALYEMMGREKVDRLIENGKIEVAPLAYMRGRTLNDAFLILDEAQNCTPSQMKMFLTRIGFGSTAVVTGDVTQTDLPRGMTSGLSDAIRVLEREKGISFFYFHPKDVVRHGLVQKIIEAYEKKSYWMKVFLNNFEEDDSFFSEENISKLLDECLTFSGIKIAQAKNYQIGISFVTTNEIKKLNLKYRGNDSATNVLSFGTNNDDEAKTKDFLLGDIVLCREIIKNEAKKYSKSYENRLKHMIIHGFLHLIGFDHEENDERISMEEIEKKIMNKISAGDPY